MSRTTRTVNAVFLLSRAAGIVCLDGSAAAPPKPKRVLVLYRHRYALPINQQWERGIRAGIEANLRELVAIDNEYLDLQRLKTDDDRRGLMDLLRLKYEALKPDVVIPVDDAAAKIFTDRAPFPDAAVVFCSIQEKTRERLPVTSQMTGVIYRWEPRRTVQCARRLPAWAIHRPQRRSNPVRRANLSDGSGSTERLNDNDFFQLGSTLFDDGQWDTLLGVNKRQWHVPS